MQRRDIYSLVLEAAKVIPGGVVRNSHWMLKRQFAILSMDGDYPYLL